MKHMSKWTPEELERRLGEMPGTLEDCANHWTQVAVDAIAAIRELEKQNNELRNRALAAEDERDDWRDKYYNEVCDACAGTGDSYGQECHCGGTGRMYFAAQFIRRKLRATEIAHDLDYARAAAAEQERDDMRNSRDLAAHERNAAEARITKLERVARESAALTSNALVQINKACGYLEDMTPGNMPHNRGCANALLLEAFKTASRARIVLTRLVQTSAFDGHPALGILGANPEDA
jgi:hypothetical protein